MRPYHESQFLETMIHLLELTYGLKKNSNAMSWRIKCAFLFNFHCCMLGSVNIGAASGLELISLLLWEPKLIQYTYPYHNSDVIMSAMASQITSLTTVYRAVYSGTDQRKHQSSTSLALVRGIHQWLVNSPQKGPVTRKMFPYDDVIIMHRFVWPGLNVLIYCRNLFIVK